MSSLSPGEEVEGQVVLWTWIGLAVLYYTLLFRSVTYAEEAEIPNQIAFWLVVAFYTAAQYVPVDPAAKEFAFPRTRRLRFLLVGLYVVSPLIVASHSQIGLFAALVSFPILVIATFGYAFLKWLAPSEDRNAVHPVGFLFLQAVLFISPVYLCYFLWTSFREFRLGPLSTQELLTDPKATYYFYSFSATYAMIWMCVNVMDRVASLRFDADVRHVARALGVSGLALGLFAQVLAYPGARYRQTARAEVAQGFEKLKSGDLKGAEGSFQRAMEVYPTCPAAAEGMLEVSLRMGDKAAAITWRDRSRDLIKTDESPAIYREQDEARVRLEKTLRSAHLN